MDDDIGLRPVERPAMPLSPQQKLLLLDTWQRSGLPARDYTGAELMSKGYTCTLKNTRNADILVLTKKE